MKPTNDKTTAQQAVATGDLFGSSDVRDALALVRVGPRRGSDQREWMNAAAAMCGKCSGTEDVNEAAARILATQLLIVGAERKIENGLWSAMQLKADMFDYLCWLDGMQSPEELHGVDRLCMASDGTTCWGKTYADAVRVAMEHDKEMHDATSSPNAEMTDANRTEKNQ